MSRKRFTTMVAVVLLLGAAGLISLYMTLGRMNEMLRAQGHAPASTQGAAPPGGEKIEQMTLTPAGASQLRAEQEAARKAAPGGATATEPGNAPGTPGSTSGSAPGTAPAPASAKPAGATGSSGH